MVFRAKNRQETIAIIQNLTDQEELKGYIERYYDDQGFLELVRQYSPLIAEEIIQAVVTDKLFDRTKNVKNYLTDKQNVRDMARVEELKAEYRTIVSQHPKQSTYGLGFFIDELSHEAVIVSMLLKVVVSLKAKEKFEDGEALKTKLKDTYSTFVSDYKEYLPELAGIFSKELHIEDYINQDIESYEEVIEEHGPDAFYPLLHAMYLRLKHELEYTHELSGEFDDILDSCKIIFYIILDGCPDIPADLLDESKLISKTKAFFEGLLKQIND